METANLRAVFTTHSRLNIFEKDLFSSIFKFVLALLVISLFSLGYAMPSLQKVYDSEIKHPMVTLTIVIVIFAILTGTLIYFGVQIIKKRRKIPKVVLAIVNHELDEDRPLLSQILLDQGEKLFETQTHTLFEFQKECGISFGRYFAPIKKDMILELEPIVLFLQTHTHSDMPLEERKNNLLQQVDEQCTDKEITYTLENSIIIEENQEKMYFYVTKETIVDAMKN